ncbi:MAG: translation initiation factor IF-3, partial [Candidatus Omnitrophica bacterium]|nr:translation initiation factor IF-3 [Candidatus Omnitrophota bacterium]
HLKKFLERGDKAKMTMVFRGREMAHMDIGRKVLDRAVADLADIGEVEKGPTREGRSIQVYFIPRSNTKVKK